MMQMNIQDDFKEESVANENQDRTEKTFELDVDEHSRDLIRVQNSIHDLNEFIEPETSKKTLIVSVKSSQ